MGKDYLKRFDHKEFGDLKTNWLADFTDGTAVIIADATHLPKEKDKQESPERKSMTTWIEANFYRGNYDLLEVRFVA